jgi:hypothetical protein
MRRSILLPSGRALPAFAWAALAALFACWSGSLPTLAQVGPDKPNFEMAAQEQPFLRVAEAFISAAAAGERDKIARMLSPAITGRTGPEGVERFLTDEVLPFFAPYKELARSVSITRTAEVTGFAFYMYMVSKTGELRPFVICVIEEEGAKVVANVLVDRVVEGRHCLNVAGGWRRCLDFS